ncbi:hypothetical protein Cpir12675_002081 [Ceratocystis pirilliformis]|uniref:Uncharacterized protein n=1 Tax=Ceratocystis pirilliformis TaxID=259994 RepID=A0ABR3ZD32_9PEZI
MPSKALFHKASPPSSRSRTSSASIRGKISAPIPFPDPLEDDYQLQVHLQEQKRMAGSAQSPIAPPMSIPTSIPEGQPISMPIVPNSTLAQAQARAVATETLPASPFIPSATPPLNENASESVNGAVARAVAASPSPLPPLSAEAPQNSESSQPETTKDSVADLSLPIASTRPPNSTPVPASTPTPVSIPVPVPSSTPSPAPVMSSRPLPTPSPTPTMAMANASTPHGRSYSQNQMHREGIIQSSTNNGSISSSNSGSRMSSRGRPPVPNTITRTSAATSIGTERTSKTNSTVLSSHDNAPAVASSLRGQIHGHSQSQSRSQPQLKSQKQARPDSTAARAAIPERKKSTLRSAFSRLFGKKRAKAPQPELVSKVPEGRASSIAPSPAEISRINQFQPPTRPPGTPEPKRSISLSIVDHDNAHDRALRSHSVGPNDMAAIESARNSANFESTQLQAKLQSQVQTHQQTHEPQSRPESQFQPHAQPEFQPHAQPQASPSAFFFNAKRRAASTGGDFFVPPRSFFAEPSGLSPRPASSQCRNRTPQEDEMPDGGGSELVGTGTGTGIGMGAGVGAGASRPDEIGKAITSQDILRNRRRSRSVPGIGLAQGTPTRRRSDEIRYWRQSHAGAFALSPNYNRGPMADTDNMTVRSDCGDAEPDTHAESDSARHNHSRAEAIAAVIEESQTLQPPTLRQPFDFGTITSPMKITEAVSLESRVGRVEGRLGRLEKTLNSFHHVLPGFRLTDDGARFDVGLGLGLGTSTSSGGQPNTILTATGSSIGDTSRGGTSLGDTSVGRTSFGTGTTLDDCTGIGSRSSADIRLKRPSSSQQSEDSHAAFVQTPVFLSSLHAAPAPAPRAVSPSPTSTAGPGLATEASGSITNEQYTRLLSLIEAERAARAILEAEVYRLAHALNLATSPATASGRRPTLTASTSALPLSSSAPPRNFSLHYAAGVAFNRTANETSMFYDEDTRASGDNENDTEVHRRGDGRGNHGTQGHHNMHSLYAEDSTFLTSDSSLVGATDADREDGLDSGLGGDESIMGHSILAQEAQRKTARTMSLSQLTLGRKPPFESEKRLEYEMEHAPQHAL